MLETMSVESPLYAAIRFLLFASISLLVGGLCVVSVVRLRYLRVASTVPEAGNERAWWLVVMARSRAVMTWALAVFAVATAGRLVLQHASYFGSAALSGDTLRPIVMQSMWGMGWRVAATSIVVAFAGLWLLRSAKAQPLRATPDSVVPASSRGSSGAGWTLLAVGTLALVTSLSMSGHAASADWPVLAIAVDALHVLGAGGWVGTLAILVLVAMPSALAPTYAADSDGAINHHDRIARLIGVFSPLALISASVLLITGVIASWRNLESFSALYTTLYGQLLLWKLAAVGVVALIGAWNWKRVTPHLGAPLGTQRLTKSARSELLMAVVVLGITAVLVATG